MQVKKNLSGIRCHTLLWFCLGHCLETYFQLLWSTLQMLHCGSWSWECSGNCKSKPQGCYNPAAIQRKTVKKKKRIRKTLRTYTRANPWQSTQLSSVTGCHFSQKAHFRCCSLEIPPFAPAERQSCNILWPTRPGQVRAGVTRGLPVPSDSSLGLSSLPCIRVISRNSSDFMVKECFPTPFFMTNKIWLQPNQRSTPNLPCSSATFFWKENQKHAILPCNWPKYPTLYVNFTKCF